MRGNCVDERLGVSRGRPPSVVRRLISQQTEHADIRLSRRMPLHQPSCSFQHIFDIAVRLTIHNSVEAVAFL